MSTSDNVRYSGKLRSSTRPNREAHERGRGRSRSRSSPRSRSRDSRRGEPQDEAPMTTLRDHVVTTRTHQPIGSTRRFARRRRTNLHRAQGRLHASSRQPLGSATSWPPHARQSATPGAPGTGAQLRRFPGIDAILPTTAKPAVALPALG